MVKKNVAMGNELRKADYKQVQGKDNFFLFTALSFPLKLIESRNLVLLTVICLAFSSA